MLKNDAVLLFEPYEMVRKSGRLPKMLEFKDEKGEEYYLEPIIEGTDMEKAKIFYEMPTKFARMLLSMDRRFKLCKPLKMVVMLPDRKRYTKVSKIVKACGKMPNQEKVISEDEIEELRIKRADKEIAEEEASQEGKAPEHMKEYAEGVEFNAKKEEMVTAQAIADKKKKQSKQKRSKSYKVGADEPNFNSDDIEKVETKTVI